MAVPFRSAPYHHILTGHLDGPSVVLTSITHHFPTMEGFDRHIQIAEFDHIRGSQAAQHTLAGNYVGFSLEAA